MKKNLGIIILFFSLQLAAQPVITDLQVNPVLKNLSRFSSSHLRVAAVNDTLYMPFIDDFSTANPFPDNTKWKDSAAYINSNYPIDPPTIGVATFDGVDWQGNPYNLFNPSAYGRADSLTSKYINLKTYRYKNHLGGDSLVPIALTDSIFLSFYYEAKGNGNTPETEDSLVVQFKRDSVWTSVMSFSGDTSYNQFKLVIIPVDTFWYKNNFQFRFVNYATLSGNLDHWHIDYVKLDKTSSINSRYINDLAFVNNPPSLLKRYQAIPWSHFTLSEQEHVLPLTIRNLDNPGNSVKSFNYQYGIYKPYLAEVAPIGRNTYPNTVDTISNNLFPFDFTATGDTKNMQFEIRATITTPDLNSKNDTVRYLQRFENFFAYDDGTAENGYGMNSLNSKLAYEFNLSHPDTLRGISIFFSQLLNNVSSSRFKLMVWNDLTAAPIYKSSVDLNPQYENTINGFHTYEFENFVLVSGKIYIGFEQYTLNLLNVGFDRNTTNNFLVTGVSAGSNTLSIAGDQAYLFPKSKTFTVTGSTDLNRTYVVESDAVFDGANTVIIVTTDIVSTTADGIVNVNAGSVYYNTSGNWVQANDIGALMMRPLVGGPIPVGIKELKVKREKLKIYPQPANDFISLSLKGEIGNMQVEIFDISGRRLLSTIYEEKISTSFLNNGFYLLQIRNTSGELLASQKFIISR